MALSVSAICRLVAMGSASNCILSFISRIRAGMRERAAGDGYVLTLAEHLLVALAVVIGEEWPAGDVQLAELVFLLAQRLLRRRHGDERYVFLFRIFRFQRF